MAQTKCHYLAASKTTLKSIYSGFSSCSHLFSCSAFLLLPLFTCPCISGVKSIFAEEQCFPMYMITKKNFGTFHIGVKHAFLPSWKQIVKQQCHHNHNRIATEINLLKIFRFKELPIISSEFRTRPRWQYTFSKTIWENLTFICLNIPPTTEKLTKCQLLCSLFGHLPNAW